METLDSHITKHKVEILPQPTDESCGPTCLHAVYNYFGDNIELESVINQVKQVKGGGTLAVMLGNHALKRGYNARIYTYNLQVFDPSWFDKKTDLSEKLRQQNEAKRSRKLAQATRSYLEFLRLGGQIMFQELTPGLIKSILTKGNPILTGLSATYLYGSPREIGETNTYDDIKGMPAGHFVLVNGYDKNKREALIADPLNPNPLYDTRQHYSVDVQRLINAILLGIVTYDANILLIQPK